VPDQLQAIAFGKAGDGFVEAFAKGLAVISAFNGEQRSLSMADVAERAELPRAGARRLLYTLVQLGYARCDEGRFELTPKIIELGRAFLSSAANLDFARPIVEALARVLDDVDDIAVRPLGVPRVHAHAQDGVAPVLLVDRAHDLLPRRVLLERGHAVLQVEEDLVGAEPRRLAEHLLARLRHVHCPSLGNLRRLETLENGKAEDKWIAGGQAAFELVQHLRN